MERLLPSIDRTEVIRLLLLDPSSVAVVSCRWSASGLRVVLRRVAAVRRRASAKRVTHLLRTADRLAPTPECSAPMVRAASGHDELGGKALTSFAVVGVSAGGTIVVDA